MIKKNNRTFALLFNKGTTLAPIPLSDDSSVEDTEETVIGTTLAPVPLSDDSSVEDTEETVIGEE
ncbi:UNVERIFIED_CONTAM: hypothetical protein FKN15_063222 [Acipenser sinensis]